MHALSSDGQKQEKYTARIEIECWARTPKKVDSTNFIQFLAKSSWCLSYGLHVYLDAFDWLSLDLS